MWFWILLMSWALWFIGANVWDWRRDEKIDRLHRARMNSRAGSEYLNKRYGYLWPENSNDTPSKQTEKDQEVLW